MQLGEAIKTLSYKGPRLHYHALSAQRADEILLYAWLDERETTEVQTELPRFSAKGTVHQTFEAFKAWLAREGWL